MTRLPTVLILWQWAWSFNLTLQAKKVDIRSLVIIEENMKEIKLFYPE